MAKYTTFLKTLIESGFDIGLNEYPIWDEEYRAILNKKITQHYWFREIGQETPGLFKFYLNRTMDEIMPYYNQLYKTTILEYNPIHNADYTEEHTITREHENIVDSTGSFNGTDSTDTVVDSSSTGSSQDSTNSTMNTNNKHIGIDTPQSALDITDADSVTYASEINFDKNNGVTDQTGNSSQESQANSSSSVDNVIENNTTGTREDRGMNTETFLRKLHGNYGVKTTQSMIKEERDLIINIDMQIIRDLEECFMNIF